MLNSNDKFYSEIRDLNFAAIGPTLNKVRALISFSSSLSFSVYFYSVRVCSVWVRACGCAALIATESSDH
jgi:hypothetical protein